MTNEKMTIHKALAELKIIDARIEKAITETTYCVANKHSNEKIKGVIIGDFNKIVTGGYDKANDLIARRDAIQRAVVLSNAITKVAVSGTDYTVAEAINMKNHGMALKERMLNTMTTQYKQAQAQILKENGADLEKRAEQYVTGLYGSKEGKTNPDDFEKTKQIFIRENTHELVDPLGILEKIDNLEKDISNFKVEVDSALSTSNAITVIEISY